jgi:hypothetical protein
LLDFGLNGKSQDLDSLVKWLHILLLSCFPFGVIVLFCRVSCLVSFYCNPCYTGLLPTLVAPPVQYYIGTDWGVSESTVCRTTQKIENILIRSGVFSLPGKKELHQKEAEEKVVVMDVTEIPMEKPKENQKSFYSGKRGEHTLKTQLIIDSKSKKIICLASGKGRVHDFKLFQNSGVRVGDLTKIIADKGYQGIAKIHELSETPIKKKKGKKLSKEEKQYK